MSANAATIGLRRVQRVPAAGPLAWRLALVWITVATSSIVFIEPAPYDLLVLASLFVFLLTGMRIPRQLGLPILLLVVFLLGNWLASLAAEHPAETLRSLGIRAYLAASVLLFACAVATAPRRMLRTIWHGYAIAALIATAWAGLQYFGWLDNVDQIRAQGAFKDPNVYGPFLVPIGLYAVESLWRRRGLVRWGWIGVFFAILFGVLISFSRGAWLNLMISAAVYLVLKTAASQARERRRLVATASALIVAAVGFVTWSVTSTPLGDRFAERARLFQAYDIEPGGRFDAQVAALQSAASQPLGVGPGQSDEAFGREPHNLYLHVISEGGWIAAIGFYAFLGLSAVRCLPLLRSVWAFSSDGHIVAAALAGTLLQSLFIDSTHWRHLYLLLAVLWGLVVVHARHTRGVSNA